MTNSSPSIIHSDQIDLVKVMLICYSKNYTNNINVCSYVNFLKPIERGRNELYVWFPALSACVCRNTHRIRNSYKPDNNRHNGIDLLQDIFQGRLLLGARFVNARTNSEYNHALCSGLRRLADSKRTAITETATGKTGNVKRIFLSITIYPRKKNSNNED